jgi:tetratricopeptide (TPR) repeat protein
VERLPARWQAIYGAASAATRGDDKAAFDALSALPADSDLPDLHYILGEIHTHRSRYHDLRKAREHFQKALDLDPAFRIVFTHLVAHLLDARDIEGARRLIDRYREESADAGALAEAEVELLFAEGDLEVALTLGEEAMNRGHGNLWMPLVTIYRYVGRPREAWELADRAFREETEIPGVAMMIRAVCASDLGRLGEAIEGYAAASDALTTSGAYGRYSAASHVARARILAATGDLEGAIAAARRALDADAWYAPGLFWLGRFQIDAGRIGEARATLASLRKVAGEAHSPSGAFWERLLQAEIHRQDGDLGKALQELGKTALLAPEHRSQEIEHMTHARVKAAFGDADGAVEAWRLCVEPRVQSVSEVNMVTPLPWYELARAEELAGNSGAAREQYRRFLRRWGRTDLPVASTRDASSRLEALDREAPAR